MGSPARGDLEEHSPRGARSHNGGACVKSHNALTAMVREEMCAEPVIIDRGHFDAAIFDLDGVLTDTARVHAAAWKAVFDVFLERSAQQHGLAFRPF